MRYLLIILSLLSFACYGQNTESTNQTVINVVRNNPLTPARVANALDALNLSKQGFIAELVTSGTDTYTLTANTSIIAYTTNLSLNVRFTNANATTSPTINVNGLGAKAIKLSTGAALDAGDISAGGSYIIRYDGTEFRMLGPAVGGGGVPQCPIPLNTYTTDHTLTGGDQCNSIGTIRMDLTDVHDVLVPLNSVTPFPVGQTFQIYQVGDSAFTITTSGGVNVVNLSGGSLTSLGKGSVMVLIQWDEDEWDMLSSSAGGGSGTVQSVNAGSFIAVDNTDPANPVVSIPNSGNGDITVAYPNWTIANNAVTTAKINNDAVTYAKMQNVSATSRLHGRITSGAGDVEELTATNAINFTGTGIRWGGALIANTIVSGAFSLDLTNSNGVDILNGLIIGKANGTGNGASDAGGGLIVSSTTGGNVGAAGGIAAGTGNVLGAFNSFAFGTRAVTESSNMMAGGFAATGKVVGNPSPSSADGSFVWGKAITGGRNHIVGPSTAMFNFGIGNQIYDSISNLPESSGIFGGYENRIISTKRAVIIGGTRISLVGPSYDNHVAVPSLAIFTTPSSGGTDDILTWNSTTKKVGKIAQPATLSLTDGNATIFNTNKIDLGAFSANVSQNGNGWHWNIGASGNRLGDFRTWSSIVSMDATTSFNYQVGSNSVSLNTTDITLAAVDDIILNPTGSIEINGSAGTSGQVLTSQGSSPPIWTGFTASATLNFGSTAAGDISDLTITVTGAAVGDVVSLGAPAIPDKGTYFAWVSATNTVTVRYANNDLTTAKDPASGTFKVKVMP